MTTAILLYSIIQFLKKIGTTQIKKIRKIERNSYQILFHTQKGNIATIYNYEKELFLPTLLKLETHDSRYVWLNKIRKYIENCFVINMQNPNFERILKITCKKYGREYNLIIELFGGGNTILTDEEDNILVIQKEIAVRHRTLEVNKKYMLPPPRGRNLLETDENKIIVEIGSLRDLFRILNIDKYTIKEALTRLNVNSEKGFFDDVKKEVIRKIKELIKIAGEHKEGFSIIKNDKGILEILPFKPVHIKPFKVSDNILDISSFFIENTLLKQTDTEVLIEKERIIKKIGNLRKSKEKLLEELTLLESWIPTLYQKADELNDLFEKTKKGQIRDYEVDYNKNVILFPVTNSLLVPLRFDINVFQSIGYLYDKEYKKRKKGIMKIESRLEELTKQLNEIEKKPIERKVTRRKRVLRERKWFEKFRWFVTSEGKLVIGGKDANTNEILIKKYLEKDDLVFHSDFYGSPFVILKKGVEASDKEIYESAIFTASYSRAWRDKIYALDVYYVHPDQISKKTPSGEYLKKGSFMVYGKKNFIRKIPLQLWIGIEKNNENIFIGPSTAAKTHCIKSLLFSIRPGDKSKKEIADLIIRIIKEKELMMIDEEIIDYYVNDLIMRLPPGKSSIETITSVE